MISFPAGHFQVVYNAERFIKEHSVWSTWDAIPGQKGETQFRQKLCN